jgi:phage-related protein
MPVSNYETSKNRGNPAELFEFRYGDAEEQVYRYTNADAPVVLANGNTYIPITISHDSIKSKGRGEAVETKIRVASGSEIALLFTGLSPRRIVTVKILKGHVPAAGDPSGWHGAGGTFQNHWFGRIVESNRERSAIVLSCSTLGAGMRSPALGMFYQRSCQHVLYGHKCKAVREDHTVQATLDTTYSAGVKLDPGWNGAYSVSAFIGGVLSWQGEYGVEYVSILGANGVTIRTDAPVRDIAPGHDMALSLGCGHTTDHCRDRFSNIVNFGGHPYIPLSNPINKNNHT